MLYRASRDIAFSNDCAYDGEGMDERKYFKMKTLDAFQNDHSDYQYE
jgi:hypothetical protein